MEVSLFSRTAFRRSAHYKLHELHPTGKGKMSRRQRSMSRVGLE
ncbi:hypothetical protein F442_09051 [Phytophthora nicotianae P10297]|uniref:Uncharacterized protein n=3 Tax=Phytophthora nicotianae TaxID=4792 RepID=V9F4R4_PHYNI|nr:hypothetical protein F443_09118 [Phytophthora nicotianae P1569]ETL39847.1 hypothetical protein L916_08855 [Phytophthora nicotianae]ETP44337.1 hypothetical protein F442_09051 [Phytophthora nicotianae P10297]